jgi:hypothetical protein
MVLTHQVTRPRSGRVDPEARRGQWLGVAVVLCGIRNGLVQDVLRETLQISFGEAMVSGVQISPQNQSNEIPPEVPWLMIIFPII